MDIARTTGDPDEQAGPEPSAAGSVDLPAEPDTAELASLRAELEATRAERDEWRRRALSSWEQAADEAAAAADFGDAAEISAMRASLSWRVTSPLRAARTWQRRLGRR